jgi:hypothetical protein
LIAWLQRWYSLKIYYWIQKPFDWYFVSYQNIRWFFP